jgi:RNA polymerase sigma-70 factor (ECF subfamily)
MDQSNEVNTQAALIEGARRGDRTSQEAIVRLYERRVYGLIVRLVGNREDARDILQDTMVKALTSINRYDGSYSFVSWLMKIGANRSLDFLRRRKLETRIFVYEDDDRGIDDLAGTGTSADDAVASKADWAVVARCMEQLQPKYRTVLHLRYKDDLAYDEIARVLSIPMGTVKVLLHRGRLELKRRVLAEVGDNQGGK